MSDEAIVESTETTEAQAAEASEATPNRVEDLPEFAQKMIAELRDEAKKYRLRSKEAAEKALSEAEAQHAEALSSLTAELESVAAERDSMRTELARLKAALNAGVPAEMADEFASRLKGETAEDYVEDAKRLLEIFQPNKPERKANPAQGQHLPLNGDPVLNMVKNKLGIA